MAEHMQNLHNGSVKSFIIAHWMENHGTSIVPPEFKWQVLDKYSDALRRQLAEGLHIIDTGVLNRKLEFNNNIICRMEASTNSVTSENQLQKELDERKKYKENIKSFINVMERVSPVLSNKKTNVKYSASKCNIKKNQAEHMPNPLLCYRSQKWEYPTSSSPLAQKKRKRRPMETSTPLLDRRESNLLDMDDDSPILKDDSGASSAYSESSDTIPEAKVKAGMSNELDTMAVTPPKELSPESMDRKLALHTVDLVKASVNNTKVLEMQEEETHTIRMADNPFARKDINAVVNEDAHTTDEKREECSNVELDGMDDYLQVDEMGKVETGAIDLNGMNDYLQNVGMDGMNNGIKEEDEVTTDLRAVGMNGMNKAQNRGGGSGMNEGLVLNKADVEKKRCAKVAMRRMSLNSGSKPKLDLKIQLGKNATGHLLESRACPGAQSPKRPTLMEVDYQLPTPPKRKKKEERLVPKQQLKQKQKLITDVWQRKDKLEGSRKYSAGKDSKDIA